MAAKMTTDEWLASLEDGHAKVEVVPEDLRAIGMALTDVDEAENRLVAAVAAARDNDRSWTDIASILGVSRQAARQRFGQAVAARED